MKAVNERYPRQGVYKTLLMALALCMVCLLYTSVMQPYTMVKDHRTNAETGNVDSVMDGNIDLFINSYLKWMALGE